MKDYKAALEDATRLVDRWSSSSSDLEALNEIIAKRLLLCSYNGDERGMTDRQILFFAYGAIKSRGYAADAPVIEIIEEHLWPQPEYNTLVNNIANEPSRGLKK